MASMTTAGKNLFRDTVSGADDGLVTYAALGTGNTAPSSSDTQLVAEVFRKAVTSYVDGSTGEILVNIYFAPGDAVGVNIQEIGFFGGNSATSSANTGVLLARFLYTPSTNPKTSTMSIQGQADITFS